MTYTRRYIPSYGELTEQDYLDMGLKSGLEVHQQIMTEKKLFCNCPAGRYEKHYDAEILRHMRPTLSELGEYDATALMEFKTKKEIIYQLHRDTVCTYEMDDAPPFALNREALHKALAIALQFKCNIVGEIHITRKQYLDGSIPAGFQRTTIVGTDGEFDYKGKKIHVIQLGLEEDACREMREEGHLRYYRTDRLSTPLIEVVTDAQMHTPWDVAGVGNAIREITRAIGLMRRGSGSGRQDVNASITGGDRVEIKGVCSIRYIPALVHYEALRQKSLLEIKEMMLDKGLKPESFKAESCNVKETLRNAGFEEVRKAVAEGATAYAVKLPKFREALTYPTGPRFNFAMELSERVRVIACLDKTPNIIYRDMVGVQFAGHQWRRVENMLRARDEDAIVVVWGPEADVKTAVNEIEIRAREALIGIPRETRRAFSDGGTGFERMLPGPDRMYPDTDMPPLALPAEDIEKARARLVTPPAELKKRLCKAGLPEQFCACVLKTGRAALCEKVIKNLELSKGFVGYILGGYLRFLNRKGLNAARVSDDELYGLFETASKGKILPSALPIVLREALESGVTPSEIAKSGRFAPLKAAEAKKALEKAKKEAPAPNAKKTDAQKRYYMGKLEPELRGRVNFAKL